MSRALAVIAFVVATPVALAAELRPKDLVGAWTVGIGPDYAYYTLWSDFRYTGSQGDALLRGTWKLLDHGRNLQLTLGGGVPKNELTVPPTSKVILIESFDGHILRAKSPDGNMDIWKKMPRWRGSPKY
jgi:hypothetical protein